MREGVILSFAGCLWTASKSTKLTRQHKSDDVADDPRQPLVRAHQIDPSKNWIMLFIMLYALTLAVRVFLACPSSYSESPDKSFKYCTSAVVQ